MKQKKMSAEFCYTGLYIADRSGLMAIKCPSAPIPCTLGGHNIYMNHPLPQTMTGTELDYANFIMVHLS